jgi:hypothetical protein
MKLYTIAGTSVKCACGETLTFLVDLDDLRVGYYRVRHGNSEAISPLIDGPSGERSMAWRDEVHAYEGRR